MQEFTRSLTQHIIIRPTIPVPIFCAITAVTRQLRVASFIAVIPSYESIVVGLHGRRYLHVLRPTIRPIFGSTSTSTTSSKLHTHVDVLFNSPFFVSLQLNPRFVSFVIISSNTYYY